MELYEVKMAKLKKYWKFVWAVLVIFCIILFYTTFRLDAREQKERYDIICFGDSIIGQSRDETSITALLAQKTGMTVYNGAFGGTCFSRLDQTRSLFQDRDGLSFAAVSQAVAYEDFAFQQTIRITDNGTEYFEENIETLGHIDFAAADVFVVAYGVNDYHVGAPLMNPEDPYDPYTFAGAIRQSIKSLQTRYPKTRILLLTPTYRWITETDEADETGESHNTGYGNLLDYVTVEKEIAQAMNVELLDHYDLYPHETYEDWRLYTIDGLHPNPPGRERIAQAIADYLSDTS
jgi:lysophospholipase L1-like esterase